MKRYEISVWDDVYDSNSNRFIEEKIAVIGSNLMTSQNRALEPNLKSNVNGTNIFSFYMYYDYIDNKTGERIKNPFIKLLSNERKVKVYWENKWYDLIVKSVVEDTSKHTFNYTCEDLYLTELSRNGFELEFKTELQNNIGTAKDLVERTLENTDWQFKEGDTIYQEIEEPVYEVRIESNFTAFKNPQDEPEEIISGNSALIYYSCAPDKENLNNKCQFYYSGTTAWQQDINDMLVINGNCYIVDVIWEVKENNTAVAKIDGNIIFTINFAAGLSRQYRAKRYIQSQKTIYNYILNRYVNVYNYNGEEENVLGYETTEYNDALVVVNLVSNSSNFANMSGWTGTDLTWKLSPSFNGDTDITNYTSTSFLKLKEGYIYNSGIQNNRQYIKDGFIEGEYYIFRIKAKFDGSEPANELYITNPDIIRPTIESRNMNYEPTGDSYFRVESTAIEDNWIEFRMLCTKSRSYDSILSVSSPFGIFIHTIQDCWLEEAQFFKEIYGVNGDNEKVRINPGEMDLQSIVQPVWKYFYAEQEATVNKDTLEYIYTSLEEWNEVEPVYNNYEKFAFIDISQSNRFNILQTIAESFECWVCFIIEHDDQGYIKYIKDKNNNDIPCKYVQLKQEIGEDTGLSFVYGIDLQSIKRDIKSSSISTKTIVSQNDNEFGKNGFCSIARSIQNYPRENFIYNFDYFIRQGLLDGNILNNDLYGTEGLAYYSNLHNLNSKYMQNLELILNKKNELIKQTAMQTVYNQYLSAAREELQDVEDETIKLAGVDSYPEVDSYIKQHINNTKVKSLIDDRSIIKNSIETYDNLFNNITNSINNLTSIISEYENEQDDIIRQLTYLNQQFYKKYSRYIQEGTWSSEDYYDDDLYYLDALQVAYTSSRPQISYDIKVIRLSELEEFSSKIFRLGDICYIQDTDYFGYLSDGFTPYKEQIYISEITSYFDSPDKDVITVQNYKTQFDDLFQRITAATQSLEFSKGKYNKAANIINTDGTIKSSIIQSTFDSNIDLVYGAQNDSVTMDNTGITVTSNDDAAKQVKITSGGVFVSNDGGMTWKQGVRGDGITADVITTGSLNVEQVTIYGKDSPSFLWNSKGINAFEVGSNGTNFSKYVRFDKYGIYGIRDEENFSPNGISDIYNHASFGLTWEKFFMKSSDGTNSIEISTDQDILVKHNQINRVKIGRLSSGNLIDYGIEVRNNENEVVFSCNNEGAKLAGWELGANGDEYKYLKSGSLELRSNGTIGCFETTAQTIEEATYEVTTLESFQAVNMRTKEIETIPSKASIYVFTSYIGNRITAKSLSAKYSNDEDTNPTTYPNPKTIVQFIYGTNNYLVENVSWSNTIDKTTHITQTIPVSAQVTNYNTTYTYYFALTASNKFTIPRQPTADEPQQITPIKSRYIPPQDFKWSIDQAGDAIFHNITADGGLIAGWFIDHEKIYQTTNGEPNGPIKTQLNSQGTASAGGYDYSIITDAIKSAMAMIGNVKLADGLINGQDIVALANAVQYAIDLAWSALREARKYKEVNVTVQGPRNQYSIQSRVYYKDNNGYQLIGDPLFDAGTTKTYYTKED